MSAPNSSQGPKPITASWPVAMGLGIVIFAAMVSMGGYPETTAVGVSAVFIVFFGVMIEWMFYERDPGDQVTQFFSPSELMTYESLFGKSSGASGKIAATLASGFAPSKLSSYDKMPGGKYSTEGAERLAASFGPSKLTSYDKMFGGGPGTG